jgi:hypothetical protein
MFFSVFFLFSKKGMGPFRDGQDWVPPISIGSFGCYSNVLCCLVVGFCLFFVQFFVFLPTSVGDPSSSWHRQRHVPHIEVGQKFH